MRRTPENGDSYLNPFDIVNQGVDAGQAIDVVSTRDAAKIYQQTGAEEQFSVGLADYA